MSDTGLTVVIGLCVMLSGALSFADDIIKRKTLRLAFFLLVSTIAVWASYRQVMISANEKKLDDSVRRSDYLKFKVELAERDEGNKREADQRVNSVRDYFKQQLGQSRSLQVVSPLNTVTFESTSEGILVTYHLARSVGDLYLLSDLETFEKTFGPSFGDIVRISLPIGAGDHSIIIGADKLPFGRKLKIQLKGERPYVRTPQIELDLTGQATIDDSEITADSDLIIDNHK